MIMGPFFLLSLASAGFAGCVFEKNQNAAPPVSQFAEEIKMELPRGWSVLLTNNVVVVAYIARNNRSAARKIGESILKKLLVLGQFPRMGKVFPKLAREDVREIPVRPYRIIYHVQDNKRCVTILTVWHGARIEPKL
ncbi:MAG: hypothetical protein DME24_25410 [Verrucomicrobia bacterium]|nr:MAG: hypothetical protein DME24_25410 [Verrucomicrobiota bacterium]